MARRPRACFWTPAGAAQYLLRRALADYPMLADRLQIEVVGVKGYQAVLVGAEASLGTLRYTVRLTSDRLTLTQPPAPCDVAPTFYTRLEPVVAKMVKELRHRKGFA